MATSKFYFDAMAYGKDLFLRDLPMFAIHTGQSVAAGWDSARATDAGGLRMLMEIVNPQVPVFVAMPRLVQASHFAKDRSYSKLSMYAYRGGYDPSDVNGGYRLGSSTVLVLKNVKVMDVQPIMLWGNLPTPPDVQKTYLEKKMGREAYMAAAVKLFASTGDIA